MFTRGDGTTVVCAVTTVFDDRSDSLAAWSAMADDEAAESFAASVADAVVDPSAGELLGPTMLPSHFVVERSGTRTATHHARYAQVIDEQLMPLQLDVAAICAGTLLEVIWYAGRGSEDRGVWRHLVHRAEFRCSLALGSGG